MQFLPAIKDGRIIEPTNGEFKRRARSTEVPWNLCVDERLLAFFSIIDTDLQERMRRLDRFTSSLCLFKSGIGRLRLSVHLKPEPLQDLPCLPHSGSFLVFACLLGHHHLGHS